MADNDFFKIVYIILYELYETKKEGKLLKKENIDYKRFKIPYSYYADIISELFENRDYKKFKFYLVVMLMSYQNYLKMVTLKM